MTPKKVCQVCIVCPAGRLFELWIFPTSPDLIERRQHSDHQSGRYSDRVHGLFQHDLVAVGQLQKHQSSLSNKVQYDVMLIGN